MATVDVLLPTCNRLNSLVMTLSGLALQSLADIHVIVSDQSDEPIGERKVVKTLLRVITARGGSFEWHYRETSQGIAEQRDFLLRRASVETVLYLDDDVLMEPWVLDKLYRVLVAQGCGFVGAFPAGLSHVDDVRPQEQLIEYWQGTVQPEVVDPGSPSWERWKLHRAANLYHVATRLAPGESRL